MITNKKHKKAVRLMILSLLILAGVAFAQSGGDFDLTKSLIGGGGGVSSGAGYYLQGSMGQKAAGQSSAGSYQVTVGFWQENTDLIYTDEFESQTGEHHE